MTGAAFLLAAWTCWTAVQAAGLPAGSAAPASFEIGFSEKLDAAVFLNAISDDPRFSEPWRSVRKEWRAKFAADPAAAKALERWSGRGIQLAYLLSAIPEDSLAAVLKRFDDPKSLARDIRAGLDEPAYEGVLRDLEARPDEVRTILGFLAKSGFLAMRDRKYGDVLQETRRLLEVALFRVDAGRLADLLEAFAGRKAPGRKLRISVLVFSNPMSFQLSGFAVGWGTQKGSLAWLLAHEFLHKFNPGKENLDALKRLADGDPFYREAWDRVYGEFGEGKEEEFVEAAARFALLKLGLASPARNLRSMKLLYFSERSQKGGVPLAAVLYDALARRQGGLQGFDYNRFIAAEFSSGRIRAGKVEEAFRKAIKPVSGLAGMVIKEDPKGARVDRVFDGYPAQKAGIAPGDLITRIGGAPLAGKSLDEMLDAVAGEAGASFDLSLRGTLSERQVRLVLR
ncbi:MAG: PDZ domain-containing protein [Elusimicrobia bacterium]|nr:PDZ domain-containing protein [Elusimicrobiota bacterium]